MKTAIVCDWLVAVGGAENVIGSIITCYPDADIFAVVDFVDADKRGFLQGKEVTTSFIQKMPFAKHKYRSYLPLMPLAIEQLDLSSYDLIISSSHAVAKGVLTGPDQTHICYIHSPMRYAWDLQHHYLRETGLDKKLRGWLARYFLHKLRIWDLRSAMGVDHFIANSAFIAKRVQKIYRRDATVIHPPVETSTFTPGRHKKDFYLTASRLVPYKKIDLIVESFQSMPDKQLIVIGDGPDMDKIKNKSGANVKILGYQSRETLIKHMQEAKAFIFAAEEDFGIIPLEAQACGTPVIAYGKGGALETVRGISKENPTGLFFNEQTVPEIMKAVNAFEENAHLFTIDACVAHADKFKPDVFKNQLRSFINQCVMTAERTEANRVA